MRMLRRFGKSIWAKWLPAVLGIFAGSILLGYYLLPTNPDLPPVQAINHALETTAQARNYEYKITMSTVIDGKEQVVSTVSGEREDKNRIHIKGKINDSEVDFYQIDTTTYTKDQLTGEWLKITDNQINQQEIFMNELNPMANFSFKELSAAAFAGIQKEGSKKFWVYTANPVVNNKYMQILWKQFQYKFYLEPRSLLINNVEVTAVSKQNSVDKLKVVVEFKNYNSSIKVVPPRY
jgi:predicted transcriptional regulator